MTGRYTRPRPERARPGAEIRAAGAVLYRYGAQGMEVAVIHRPRHDDWSFPKGKLEPGEHVLVAAVREVTEETGIRPVLGRPLATVRYQVEGGPKRVDYWAARVDDPAAGNPFIPGDEVDTMLWLPVPEARARLSYAHDTRLLERLAAPAADGMADARDTLPFVLLRHASAGRKSAWHGDDLLRPLDDRGKADAATLARLLACYGVRRLVSSVAERCVGTVRPYAERIGAPVETELAFTVPAPGGVDRTEEARQRLAELLADPSPTVVCGHRENLPVLFRQARDMLRDAPPPQAWSPPKAGFWVLHVAADSLAAVEHHTVLI